MTRSRGSLREGLPGSSPESDEDSSDGGSLKEDKTPVRGRRGDHSSSDDQLEDARR